MKNNNLQRIFETLEKAREELEAKRKAYDELSRLAIENLIVFDIKSFKTDKGSWSWVEGRKTCKFDHLPGYDELKQKIKNFEKKAKEEGSVEIKEGALSIAFKPKKE